MMTNENLKHAGAVQAKTVRQMLLPLFVTLIFAMSFSPAKAQAQITGNMVADVPFQFHVGNTTLPAGEYVIHQLEGNDLAVMQISSRDGSVTALFDVEPTVAKSEPKKSELFFNKYGDSYFLSEMFEEGTSDGSKLLTSRDEKRASKEGGADIVRVTAHSPNQQGN